MVTPRLKSRVTPSSVNTASSRLVHPASAKEMVPGRVRTAEPELLENEMPPAAFSTFMRPYMVLPEPSMTHLAPPWIWDSEMVLLLVPVTSLPSLRRRSTSASRLPLTVSVDAA